MRHKVLLYEMKQLVGLYSVHRSGMPLQYMQTRVYFIQIRCWLNCIFFPSPFLSGGNIVSKYRLNRRRDKSINLFRSVKAIRSPYDFYPLKNNQSDVYIVLCWITIECEEKDDCDLAYFFLEWVMDMWRCVCVCSDGNRFYLSIWWIKHHKFSNVQYNVKLIALRRKTESGKKMTKVTASKVTMGCSVWVAISDVLLASMLIIRYKNWNVDKAVCWHLRWRWKKR